MSKSCNPLNCACAGEKGAASSMGISVPCTIFDSVSGMLKKRRRDEEMKTLRLTFTFYEGDFTLNSPHKMFCVSFLIFLCFVAVCANTTIDCLKVFD